MYFYWSLCPSCLPALTICHLVAPGPAKNRGNQSERNCTTQINIMMKKKEYQTPMTEVIVLEQQAQLLAGSGESVVGAELTDYGTPVVQDWD